MAQNAAPNTETFCVQGSSPSASPAVRFVGGGAIEPQIDPSQGPPTSCGLTLNMVSSLQPALAAFRPFLNLLDLVATLVQCFQLSIEVLSNPTKLKELLKLVPALAEKLNVVLGLIPQLPQGIQAWVTMIVDIIRFVGTMLDCAIQLLTSIKTQFENIEQLQAQLEGTDDPEVADGLSTLIKCGQAQASENMGNALSALGPIARVLCAVRGLLQLVPGGKQIQKLMALPDPRNISSIDDAITALSLTRDVLLTTVDALIALTGGLGVLPPLEVGFSCPLDSAPDEEEEPAPPPLPTITALFAADGVTPLASLPQIIGGVGPDTTIYVGGTNLLATTKIFWVASRVQDVSQSGALLRVVLPASLLGATGVFQISAVNEPAQGGGPFSSIADPSTGDVDSDVMVSDPFPIEVV